MREHLCGLPGAPTVGMSHSKQVLQLPIKPVWQWCGGLGMCELEGESGNADLSKGERTTGGIALVRGLVKIHERLTELLTLDSTLPTEEGELLVERNHLIEPGQRQLLAEFSGASGAEALRIEGAAPKGLTTLAVAAQDHTASTGGAGGRTGAGTMRDFSGFPSGVSLWYAHR